MYIWSMPESISTLCLHTKYFISVTFIMHIFVCANDEYFFVIKPYLFVASVYFFIVCYADDECFSFFIRPYLIVPQKSIIFILNLTFCEDNECFFFIKPYICVPTMSIFFIIKSYLFVPTASISSINTIDGACSSATLNNSLTNLGPSP